MKDWIIDQLLGMPGLVIFICGLLFLVAATTSPDPSPDEMCKQAGGKVVYTMKSYHYCKLEKK